MFDTLVESRPRRQRRAGGSMVSIAVHAAAVFALVVATARAGERVAEPPPSERVYFPPVQQHIVPRAYEPTPPARCTTCVPNAADVPAMPLVPPVDIPLSIPDVGVASGLTDRLLNDVRVSRGAAGSPDGVVGGRGLATEGPYFEWSVERPAMLAPGARSPSYPEALRAAGITGTVLVEFVVDTSGRVEAGTVKLVSSDHSAFFAAVERSLPMMRFLPAEAGGRRVRQHVRLPFRFDLDRD